MSAAILAQFPPLPTPLDDSDIHARAWAVVEAVLDSVPDRLVLLHASAMLLASLAHGQPDPLAVLEEMLADQSAATMGILRTALASDPENIPTERKS